MIYNVMGDVTYANTILANAAIGLKRNSGRVVFDHLLRHEVAALYVTQWESPLDDRAPLTGDPLLAVDGYHLRRGSAAIDAGLDLGVAGDIDNGPRPLGTAPDVGADESPYSPDDTAVQAQLLAAAPQWKVYYTGDSVPPSTYLEQRYLLPFAYFAPDSAPAITTFALTDDFPAALTLEETRLVGNLHEEQVGNELTWTSLAPLLPGQLGWISLTGRSDTVVGGDELVSAGQMDYTLANAQTRQHPLHSDGDRAAEAGLSPRLYTPLDGEMCVDAASQLVAKGVAGAGMTVKLYEGGAFRPRPWPTSMACSPSAGRRRSERGAP